jgi:ribosomal protein L5
MQVPRINKITLTGVSEAVADKKVMDNAVATWLGTEAKSLWSPRQEGYRGFQDPRRPADCMVTLRRGVRCMSSRPFQTVACRVYVTSVVLDA